MTNKVQLLHDYTPEHNMTDPLFSYKMTFKCEQQPQQVLRSFVEPVFQGFFETSIVYPTRPVAWVRANGSVQNISSSVAKSSCKTGL